MHRTGVIIWLEAFPHKLTTSTTQTPKPKALNPIPDPTQNWQKGAATGGACSGGNRKLSMAVLLTVMDRILKDPIMNKLCVYRGLMGLFRDKGVGFLKIRGIFFGESL